jgi:hypothetical protein
MARAGTTSFAGQSDYGVGSGPTLMASGDFDQDGRPDLVVVNPALGFESQSDANILLSRLDAPTATLLTRFEAVWVGSGIEVRWEFGPTSDVVSTALERSESANGPWGTVSGSLTRDGAVNVLSDRDVESGRVYWYRLVTTLTGSGTATFGPVSASGAEPAVAFALTSIGPTPSTGPVRITFTLPREAQIRMHVLDVQGRNIATLVDGPMPPGRHEALWPAGGGTRPPAGLYFVRLTWPGGSSTRRIALTE